MHQDHFRILHSLPHPYLVMTPDFTIIDANSAYCELTFVESDSITSTYDGKL
jgi:PAS domain-containing protein